MLSSSVRATRGSKTTGAFCVLNFARAQPAQGALRRACGRRLPDSPGHRRCARCVNQKSRSIDAVLFATGTAEIEQLLLR